MSPTSTTPSVERVRHASLGRKLSQAARRYDRAVIRGLADAGFDDIRVIHAAIMQAINLGGSSITEIADSCNMTKQAVGNLVRELESLGYLRVMIDSQDARSRVAIFSARGHDMLASLADVFARVDERLCTLVGNDNLRLLEKVLDELADAAPQES